MSSNNPNCSSENPTLFPKFTTPESSEASSSTCSTFTTPLIIIGGVGSVIGIIISLVIAGLVADGFSVVDDIKYILRGYEKFDEKIRALGGQIAVAETEKDIQKFKLKVG